MPFRDGSLISDRSWGELGGWSFPPAVSPFPSHGFHRFPLGGGVVFWASCYFGPADSEPDKTLGATRLDLLLPRDRET